MKKSLENIKKNYMTIQPNRIEWAMAGIVFTLIFCTMYYTDNFDIFTTHFRINEQLFEGKSINILGSISLPYGLLHQWICEIWVLPINLLYHLFGIASDSIVAILWYKSCIVIFLTFCVRELGNIAETLRVERTQIKWLQFLFVTTILVALPVLHIAQTDSMYLLFMLKGFHALLKGDTKKFFLWFAASVSFKMISIFAFIPLVLLVEKRIWYVMRDLVGGCIIIPGQQIWYRIVGVLNGLLFPAEESGNAVSSAVQAVESRERVQGNFLTKIYNNVLYFEFPAVVKGYTASLLVFLFALLCIWCYMQKKENTRDWQQKCLYVTFVALSIFFMMVSPGPYWIVILYPFLYLLIYTNQEKLRFNLILEKFFSLCLFLVYVMNTYWVFGGSQSFDGLFFTKWGIIPSGHELMGKPNVARYLEKAGVGELMPIVTAICLASVIGIVWINYPKVKCDEELTEEYKIELQHGFATINVIILFVWYALNVVLIGRY